MRMWMVNPVKMCYKHLCGEHGEIHKHRHVFEKLYSIENRKGQILPFSMKIRHDELEAEIRVRALAEGRKPPSSPYELPDLTYYQSSRDWEINVAESEALLAKRCPRCLHLINALDDRFL